MKESLTNRVGRLISGSFNALVSAMEDAAPEIVMEEAMREIDSAIDEVRVELGRQTATRHLANQRLEKEQTQFIKLQEQVDTAVQAGRDDLAKVGIARQLDIEAQLPVLRQAVSEAENKEQELEAFIKALQAKKREMQEELRQLREAQNQASQTVPHAESNQVNAKVARAESTFSRLMEKHSGLVSGSSTGDAAKLAELEELARQNRIKERLAAIKAKGEQGTATIKAKGNQA